MTQKAPAMFIGHGSPMNAIEDTPASRGWRDIAARYPKPRAIVCVSAHWITEGVRVTANAAPRTIHDFGGFPPELFAVQYPAPGDPVLARDIAGRLSAFGAATDERWGLDHGTWSVLVHMYPEANVPVLQVSLDARRSPAEHYAIGQALAALRDENVLIIGSGDIVHNLRAFFRRGGGDNSADERAFDDHIVAAIEAGDDDASLNYASHPHAHEAAPDWDHFFPLFYTLGARVPGERAHVFNRDFFPGISMTSIAFGLPQ
jgi:4,5-DOPA dioxygenase extradiol